MGTGAGISRPAGDREIAAIDLLEDALIITPEVSLWPLPAARRIWRRLASQAVRIISASADTSHARPVAGSAVGHWSPSPISCSPRSALASNDGTSVLCADVP